MAKDAKGIEIVEDEKPAPDHAKEIADLKAQNAAILDRLAKFSPPGKDKEDPDLQAKAKLQREENDKKVGDTKQLETSLRFTMGAAEFLKINESLLPNGISDIFTAAEKEKYDSAVDKASAIKAGIIKEFFSVQANVDLLTPGLKSSLDDYLKLTNTGKQEKAQAIYDGIFEPAFEMLKRVKKAEALGKGFGGQGDGDMAYKNKMMKLSKEHYGVK